MAKSIGMTQAKSKLAELVGRVAYGGERFVLERRGQPMAVLINVDEYRRLRNLEWETRGRPFPPELQQRQEQLVGRAHRLRKRLGDPVDGLAELLSSLPPEEDTFWLELIEEMP
jgi:prevent-host-death family protein